MDARVADKRHADKLQEFILELAALVQVRASLFGDVRFA